MISENLLLEKTISWFDVVEPQAMDFDRLSSEFNLPSLLVQDTLRPEHLPKYESTDEGHFLMFRSFDRDSTHDATTVQDLTRKIALFVTDDRLLSIHRVELDYLAKVADACNRSDSIKTIQALVHKIILAIIRSYENPIDRLLDQYEEFETDILSRNADNFRITRIYHFRRQMFLIKRILKQSHDALTRSKEFWVDSPSMLQDLKENIDQLYFQLDEIADNFEHLFQLHIALNDQRANEVMKILTVFSTILLPLNFMASFYGMNVVNLPGQGSQGLIYLLLAMMGFLAVFTIWYFRRKGWFKTPNE